MADPIKIYISKEIFDSVKKFTERHIPIIPFETSTGNYYPHVPITEEKLLTLTDIDLRSLLVAGNGKVYSQYICTGGNRTKDALIIERLKFKIKKTIRRAAFKPAPGSKDLTYFYKSNQHRIRRLEYNSGCYNCKKPINNTSPICEDCNRYYMCSNCNHCICDKNPTMLM